MRKAALLVFIFTTSSLTSCATFREWFGWDILYDRPLCPHLSVYEKPVAPPLNAETLHTSSGKVVYILTEETWRAVGQTIAEHREVIERFQSQARTINEEYAHPETAP